MSSENKKTILLVEDEALIALGKKVALEKYGYTVLTVTTGEKAIEIIKGLSPIDLILMDIDLGRGMDGTQAASLILEICDLPLIFLSSHTEPEIVEKTEMITSYGYVVKNSSITVLNASIKMAFKLFSANYKIKTTMNKLEATLNTLPDMLFEVGLDGYCYDIHTQHTELLFKPPEEMIGKRIRDFIPLQAADVIMSAIEEAYEKGYSAGKQYELMVPAGTRSFEISVAPIARSKEKPRFIYLTRDITDRKFTESSLKEKEEKYHNINNLFKVMANTMSDLIWAKDLDKNYLFANKATCDKLLYSKDASEPIGKGDMFFVNRLRNEYPDNPDWHTFGELCIDSDEETLKAGKAMQFYEYGNVCGKFLYLDVHKAPLYNSDGILIGVVGSARDITENKKMEDKLFLSEETYSGIIDSLSEAVFIQDKDGKFLNVNHAVEKIYGYKREYFVGKDPSFITAPGKNDLDKVSEYVKKAYSGVPESFEFWGRKKDGTIFPKTVSLTSGDYFGTKAVIAVASDISESKKNENLLRDNNAILNSIANTMQSALIMIGREGRVYFWNPAAERLLGYTAEEVLGKNNIENLIAPERYRGKFRKALDKFLKNGEGIRIGTMYESEVINRNGVEIPVEIGLSAVKIHGSWRAVELIRDISERKVAKEKINGLLTEKNTLLKEVHHRIKNNMNTIRSLLIIQAGLIEDVSSVEVLEDAAGRVQSMMKLYDKLYRSSGYDYLSVKEYLSPLVGEIIDNFPNSNSVEIEKYIEDFILDVSILQPLGIIVNELLTNIMKYAFTDRANGIITVSASILEKKVSIIIKDNGKGIPESISFENSKGFGLMLVSMLTKQIGGTIRIERGNGTEINLEFPN